MSDAPGGVPQRVVGRYALYGEIASGGMATVHFGRLLGPVGFSRTVAIKRLHPQFAKDPEFVSMFLDEARVAARIQHPNVVATLDVVALQGELFLVMEYVQGESLARIQRNLRHRHDRLPPRMVGSIATNLLFGLHAAHEAKSERGEPLGIVHRDVSPQNVLVGIDGVSRVLDFGVAKAAGRIQVTREGQVKGKLAYMPPEQLAGGAIDRRADVYAAAVLTWEALTGKRLFDGDNQSVILAQVLTAEVEPPSRHCPGLPPGVDEVVMRGLARNPDVRFATAHEMAVALEETLGMESPRRVGELIGGLAAETLAAKAAQVKEIESLDSDTAVQRMRQRGRDPGELGESGPQLSTFHDHATRAVSMAPLAAYPPAGLPAGEASGLSRVSSVSMSLPGEPRRPYRAIVAFVAVGALLGGAAFLWSLRGEPPPAGPAASVPPPGSAAPAAPPLLTGPVTSGETSAPAGSEVAAPAASPATRASSQVSSRPPARPRPPAPPPRPKPPAGGGCDPPYTLDATGKRTLKPQCL